MKSKRENLSSHINLKISNKLFQSIDTLRAEHLIQEHTLPSRSEMIRILLLRGIESISEINKNED
jgi:metal-responsive CopG/Arc/MetJ family transcriptional regulator